MGCFGLVRFVCLILLVFASLLPGRPPWSHPRWCIDMIHIIPCIELDSNGLHPSSDGLQPMIPWNQESHCAFTDGLPSAFAAPPEVFEEKAYTTQHSNSHWNKSKHAGCSYTAGLFTSAVQSLWGVGWTKIGSKSFYSFPRKPGPCMLLPTDPMTVKQPFGQSDKHVGARIATLHLPIFNPLPAFILAAISGSAICHQNEHWLSLLYSSLLNWGTHCLIIWHNFLKNHCAWTICT